jgi:hypothetical protein
VQISDIRIFDQRAAMAERKNTNYPNGYGQHEQIAFSGSEPDFRQALRDARSVRSEESWLDGFRIDVNAL